NTVGAIAGALAAGFVLLPSSGLEMTFRTAALLGLVASAAVWVADSVHGAWKGEGDVVGLARGRVVGPVLAAVGLGAAILMLPPWDRNLLTSGAYKYAPYVRGTDLETALRAGRLEYYKEGAVATVSVRRLAGTLALSIDGKVDASNGGDMLTQRLLGLLPVLMHEQPTDVCVIGLGSGVTLESTFATGTVATADVLEI